ncbi:hypothetical protein FS837_004734 [Tulasnella sp. UAMH 9824]|nr:hypothetical protein FS837_004734 [Tulasnella sp. UAMH 9824]
MLVNFASYSLRPLYDTPSIPRLVTRHLHAPGVPQNDLAACRRHGWDLWKPDTTGRKRKLVDAVIFSIELDLLEIRLAELYPVTSAFFILESTTTFTGLPKPLVLEPLLHPNSTDQRFKPYLDKIRYRGMEGRKLLQGEDPFNVEREMRWVMGDWLQSPEAGLDDGDLVIMSDVDEMPSRSAATLLSACSTPSPMHLQMSQHMYSFHFSLSPLLPSWRAKITSFERNSTTYTHSLPSSSPHGEQSYMLSDAGWHCSFCFPTIGDFVFKARGFSHTDRLGKSAASARELLDPERIRKVVCQGKDFFGMLPEAYDWQGLFARWSGAGQWEGSSLPELLVRKSGGKDGKWGWLIGEEGPRCNRTWEVGDDWKFGAYYPWS